MVAKQKRSDLCFPDVAAVWYRVVTSLPPAIVWHGQHHAKCMSHLATMLLIRPLNRYQHTPLVYEKSMYIHISNLHRRPIDLMFRYWHLNDPCTWCRISVGVECRVYFFLNSYNFEQWRHGSIWSFLMIIFFVSFNVLYSSVCWHRAAPICLPEKNEDFLGKFGWAAGWGALNPGSRLRPKTLQAVDVPVIENRYVKCEIEIMADFQWKYGVLVCLFVGFSFRICERWHRSNGINVVIYPEMLCAGYRGGGKDS